MPKSPRKNICKQQDCSVICGQQLRHKRKEHAQEKGSGRNYDASEQPKIHSKSEAFHECLPGTQMHQSPEKTSLGDEKSRGKPRLRRAATNRDQTTKGMSSNAASYKQEELAISQELMHNIIVHAVKSGKIPFGVLENTSLTIYSITEFFTKHNGVLASQWKQDQEEEKSVVEGSSTAQGVQDIATLPFSDLQIAFSWARSELKSDIRDAELKKKKDEARAQFKRAREIYFLKKSAGNLDLKDIMTSVCSTLEAENPNPELHRMAAPAQATLTGHSQHEKVKEGDQSKIQADKSYTTYTSPRSELSLYETGSDQPGPNFSTYSFPYRKRGEPIDALANMSPPLELPIPEDSRQTDPLIPSSTSESPRLTPKSLRKRAVAIKNRNKPNSTPQSSVSSEESAESRMLDIACPADPQRSQSPEKKQRGTRGIARPIFK